MDVAQVPAGWYRDPSARHDQRYWDGARWGPQVLDRGITSDDPTGIWPIADPFASVASVRGPGYRALRVASWRVALAGAVPVVAVLALMFEILATVLAFGATTTRDASWLAMWSWLYRAPSSSGGMTYVGFPPVAIFVGLVLVLAFFSGVTIRPESALGKAGARKPRAWSPAPDKQVWQMALDRMRRETGSDRLFNTLLRPHARVFLVLEMVAGALIAGVSYLAIAERKAIMVYGQAVPSGTFTTGWGPWICLGAGLIVIVGALLIWPWHRHEIVIRADGSVETVSPSA